MITSFTNKGYSFEWIDVFNATDVDLSDLAVKYKLPKAAVIDCLQPEHLPKFEAFENYYFMIIRYFDPICKDDADNFQQLTRKIAVFFNKSFCRSLRLVFECFFQKSDLKITLLKIISD